MIVDSYTALEFISLWVNIDINISYLSLIKKFGFKHAELYLPQPNQSHIW